MSININERESYPSNWARSCDLCHTAPCTLYCHTDSTYLCQNCDECIHLANPSSLQHERFWICTACESSPATITCQADAANLCIRCDTEIHLANPLARRHVRVPITPPPRVVPGSSNTSFSKLQGPPADKEIQSTAHKSAEELEEDEADSWLLLDLDNEENLTTSGFTCCGEVDEYLDLIEFDSCVKYECQEQNDQEQFSSVHQGDNGSDSVVPVQSFESKNQYEQQQNTFVDSGYETSKSAFINSTSSSRKVPYMNPGYYLSPSNIPNSYSRFPDRTARLLPSSSILMPLQFSLADREEKVLRYREKRKSRKFEKKIRYATRKTNAESRPRVKGRFARKKGTEFEVNQTFPAEDCGYGVVPSYEVK